MVSVQELKLELVGDHNICKRTPDKQSKNNPQALFDFHQRIQI